MENMRIVPAIVAAFVAATSLGCRTAPLRRALPPGNYILQESFDDPNTAAHRWVVDPTTIPSSKAWFETQDSNGVVSLALPEGEAKELAIRRPLDLLALRGQRVRLSVRIRTSASPVGTARIRLSAPSSAGESYSDVAEKTASSATWSEAHVVLDVSRDAAMGSVALILKGGGTAWFDDVRLTSLGPTPSPSALELSAELRERLATLSRALALVQHFHPADQSVKLDWNAFSVMAMERVLRADRREPMQRLLTELFARIAPTVGFSQEGEHRVPALARDPAATRLVRWFHQGIAPTGVYRSFREGIDAEEDIYAHLYSAIELPQPQKCASAELHASVRRTSATGGAHVAALIFQSGNRTSYFSESITARDLAEVSIARGDIPPDTRQIRIGVYLEGSAAVEISRVSLKCQDGTVVTVDASNDWAFSQDISFYHLETASCGTGRCVVASRIPAATELVPTRDVIEKDIGGGLHMILPLAVWSDGLRTFPIPEAVELRYEAALPDLPVRLAAVAATWGILAWFYPYFADQRLDWDAVLPRALSEAAAANTSERTHRVLSRLVASLRDGHGRVIHPTHPNQGILPIAFRKLGDKIVVVGGLPEYVQLAPPGSELLALDARPAGALYEAAHEVTSASTTGWHEHQALRRLAIGPLGAFKQVQLRLPDGDERSLTLPLVSRETFGDSIKERRPKSGSEVAPSIFYVDPMKLSGPELPELVSTLKQAKAIIIDQRGYIKNQMFELVGHFTSRKVPSPIISIPIATPGATKRYESAGWFLWPAMPQLTCPIIVLTDGRAISAAETVLQILKDNRLAMFIGEPSAGTNGNVNDVLVPGGFEVRFTGAHTQFPDGSTIQGHGIVPDQLVRPTLEGIRAGRDEILEAGIAAAQRLAAK